MSETAEIRRTRELYYDLNPDESDDVMDALIEVRAEITRLNDAMGHTVFNPTTTLMVDVAIAARKREGIS